MIARLLHGDCYELVEGIGPVHLAYLDPPFYTNETYRMPSGEVAFEDRWPSMLEYVRYVTRRAVRGFSELAPGSSLVVHVDPETSHHIKVALDGVLHRDNFANEIIWRYRRWPTPMQHFQRMHDVLLRYVKPGLPVRFNQLYEPLSDKTVKSWGNKRQKAVWRESKSNKLRRAASSRDAADTPGAALSDVWEIGVLAGTSSERTGYPTQKPEALLERLVLALTHPGNVVLDLMCGSGTTLVAALRHGRKAIGIDRSEVALRVARERLDRLAGAA